MDVIALAQAGLDHAVAPLGTAITEAQLEMLWKLAPEPVVALDGDPAGLAAAQRLIDLALPLLGAGRSLRFALMPPGQDPDDVVRAGGAAGDAGAARRLAADGRPALDAARPRAPCSTAPSAAPRSTPACAPTSPASPTPALRGHWEARDPQPPRRALRAAAAPGRAPRGAGAAPAPAPPRWRRRPATRALAARPRRPPAQPRRGAHPRERHPRRLPQPSRASRWPSRTGSSASSFRCRDLAEIRDALLSALAGSPDEPHRAPSPRPSPQRLGRDPLPRARRARPGARQPRISGPAADPEQAAPRHRGGTDPPRRAGRPRRRDPRRRASSSPARPTRR